MTSAPPLPETQPRDADGSHTVNIGDTNQKIELIDMENQSFI
jgi:hypothetical protein